MGASFVPLFNTTLSLEFPYEEKVQFKRLVVPNKLENLDLLMVRTLRTQELSLWLFSGGCNSQKVKNHDLIQIQNECVPKVFFTSLFNKKTIMFKM